MSRLTVVMYHYVHDLSRSKYPGIKGLDLKLFLEQIQYLKKYYQIIRMEDLLENLNTGKPLPPRALLLTFDDGYKDHFSNVTPALVKNGIQGTFFVSARAMAEKIVLDVNKIHYVLACVKDKSTLLHEIDRMIREEAYPADMEAYMTRINDGGENERRYDEKEVVLIKDLLQKGLSVNLRGRIIGALFEKYISRNQEEFANDLYLGRQDLSAMMDEEMFIGSHGYDHVWLNTLTCEDQNREYDRGIEFMKSMGCCKDGVVFSYPYGAFNDDTVALLTEKRVEAAFTSRCGLATCNKENRFTIPRLDTNDLPKSCCADPCAWTADVMDEQ